MSPTPQEVIALYEEHAKLQEGAGTTIQKQELTARLDRQLQCVQWEVEVSDVADLYGGDFILHGKAKVIQPSRWGRNNSTDMDFTAHLEGKELRERLLALKPRQRVRVEGQLSYFSNHFRMNPARLLD